MIHRVQIDGLTIYVRAQSEEEAEWKAEIQATKIRAAGRSKFLFV